MNLYRRILRPFFLQKLGSCPFCMRVSAAGMLLSWLAVIVAILSAIPVRLIVLASVVAGLFTLLFFGHMVAFWRRTVAGLTLMATRGGKDGEPMWSRWELARLVTRLLIRYMFAPVHASKPASRIGT